MLHEVLIVLAGYESPLISEERSALSDELLHPSEQALTAQIAAFGKLHRDIARRIKVIQSSYMELPISEREYAKHFFQGPYSSASHAIANSLDKLVLSPFRSSLVELETKILDRDSAYVGGDNTVSLSLIASKTIRLWERRFIYSHSLLEFVTGISRNTLTPSDINTPTQVQPFSYEIIARLRNDEVTGYQDVKSLVRSCSIAVEGSWLAQISSWVLYGRLPRNSSQDFMIGKNMNSSEYFLRKPYIPSFVNSKTAEDILLIGDCLSRLKVFSELRQLRDKQPAGGDAAFDLKTIGEHSKILFSTTLPISETQLQRNITSIRLSMFRNVIATTLPIARIKQLFILLRRIVLLGSFEFVRAFQSNIASAKNDAKDRQQQQRRRQQQSSHHYALESDAILPDAERLFNRACAEFSEDSTLQTDRDLLDLASKLLRYSPVSDKKQTLSPGHFDDLLLGIRCKLSVNIDWPLYILVSSRESDLYGALFSFLMSIRASIDRLQDMWRNYRKLQQQEQSSSSIELWQTASKAKVFLDALWDYLQAGVIDPNFNKLFDVIEDQSNREQVDPHAITACHSTIIQNLYTGSFIGDSIMRVGLRRLLVSCNVLAETVITGILVSSDLAVEIDKEISGLIRYLNQQEYMTTEISQLMVKLDATQI